MFVRNPLPRDDGRILGVWHVLGAALLRHRGDSYLCALDEGRYFVSRLRRPAASIDAAFRQLKPPAVLRAEREGLDVRRQGEWFFVPTGVVGDRAIAMRRSTSIAALYGAKLIRAGVPLPEDRPKDNRHWVARYLAPLRPEDPPWVRGRVIHRRADSRGDDRKPGAPTREHRTLDLGEAWHVAVRNTEVMSWGMSGRFD